MRPSGEKAGREQYGLIIVSFGEDYSASSAFFFAGAFFAAGFFSAASASSDFLAAVFLDAGFLAGAFFTA